MVFDANHDDEEESDQESTQTRKATVNIKNNQVHQYDEETQDDVNTINSDKTSHHMNRKEGEKVHELPSVRYNLSFTMDAIDLLKIRTEYEANNIPPEILDPLHRQREILMNIYKKIKEVEEKAKVMTWSKDQKTEYMDNDPNNMLKDGLKIQKFFDGFSLRKKEGRVYLRVRVHSPDRQEKL